MSQINDWLTERDEGAFGQFYQQPHAAWRLIFELPDGSVAVDLLSDIACMKLLRISMSAVRYRCEAISS